MTQRWKQNCSSFCTPIRCICEILWICWHWEIFLTDFACGVYALGFQVSIYNWIYLFLFCPHC